MKFFLVLGIFFVQFLYSTSYVEFKNTDALLSNAKIYIDENNSDIEDIKDKEFTKFDKKHINLGFFRGKALWIKITFKNQQNKKSIKLLEVKNPLLESITLYDQNTVYKRGVIHLQKPRDSLNPVFQISLQPNQIKTIYLKLENNTTILRAGLNLKDRQIFKEKEFKNILIKAILFTVLIIILIYSIVLFIYLKESSYLFYAFYLFSVIYQQATYLGFTQMLFPAWFIKLDNNLVVFKVNLMYITASLFAKAFLQTKKFPFIDKIYNLFIILALMEIPIIGTPLFYLPEISIATALFFIYFNLFAGVYIYLKGSKEARLFVLGWAFQIVGFTLMILDGLGIISVMHNLNNLILFLTSLEALILSFAFIDKYLMLKHQKERSDQKLLNELKYRNKIVENKIKLATKELNKSLQNEKNLMHELHHRTKNNLQLILSLVRIQADHIKNKDVKNHLLSLENRINAISKTYQLLHIKDDLEEIDMNEYIEELCYDLENITLKDLEFKLDIKEIKLPLKEAGYIGLIINEIITNSIKYAKTKNLIITISLDKKDKEYILNISDNGEGFKPEDLKSNGFGQKIIDILVKNQLGGKLNIYQKNGLNFDIRFKI